MARAMAVRPATLGTMRHLVTARSSSSCRTLSGSEMATTSVLPSSRSCSGSTAKSRAVCSGTLLSTCGGISFTASRFTAGMASCLDNALTRMSSDTRFIRTRISPSFPPHFACSASAALSWLSWSTFALISSSPSLICAMSQSRGVRTDPPVRPVYLKFQPLPHYRRCPLRNRARQEAARREEGTGPPRPPPPRGRPRARSRSKRVRSGDSLRVMPV